MIRTQGLEKRKAFPFYVEAAISIQKALMTFTRNYRAKSKVTEVLLISGCP